MSLNEIKELLLGGGGLVLLLSFIVQISPIKVNPWSKLARALGKALNGEILDKLTEADNRQTQLSQQVMHIEESLAQHIADSDEQDTISRRLRILRFGDEVTHGIRHSKDHFDQILEDITAYAKYCDKHPDFKNDMTVITTKRIKDVYAACLVDNDFM